MIADKYGLSLDPTRRRLHQYDVRLKDDLSKWKDALSDLRRQNHFVVGHASDIHAPFHDQQALNLSYQTTHHLQPNIVVVGSDFADFPTISAYAPDPDLGNEDILETIQQAWWRHIDDIRKAAPNAVLVWIRGNHEERLWRFINESAPQIRNTTRDAFINLIRYQGNVLYLGDIPEIEIGPLTVLHGDNTCIGDMAARKLLTHRRFQGFYMFGHNHKITEYTTQGNNRLSGAAGGGHLGQRIPHYQRNSKFNHWIQGTCYGIVDWKADYVAFENLKFQVDNKGTLHTSIGSTHFTERKCTSSRQTTQWHNVMQNSIESSPSSTSQMNAK